MATPRNVKLQPLSSLKRWERNYRVGNVDAIIASLKRFGFNGALRVWKGTVVAGNHTLIALQLMRERGDLAPAGVVCDVDRWLVACVDVSHLSEQEATAFAIADNRTAQLAQDNEEMLAALLSEVTLGAPDAAAATGYSADDLHRLLRRVGERIPVPEPENPDAEDFGEVRPKAGEVWKLGPHTLICGDATDAALVAAVADEVDLVVTDPPYGVGYRGRTKIRRAIAGDEVGDESTRDLVKRLMLAAPLKAGGVFYVCSPAGPSELAFRLGIADAGLRIRQSLVWVKNTFVMGRSDYHYRHESILYGWREGEPHYFAGDRTLDTVLEYPKPTRSDDHPTIKPIELIEFLIGWSSRAGELVYDCCAGSGTTLLACEQAKRICVAVELDPRYCEVILRRWEKATTHQAVRAA